MRAPYRFAMNTRLLKYSINRAAGAVSCAMLQVVPSKLIAAGTEFLTTKTRSSPPAQLNLLWPHPDHTAGSATAVPNLFVPALYGANALLPPVASNDPYPSLPMALV